MAALPLLAQLTRKGYTRRSARSRNGRRHHASRSRPRRVQQNLSLAIKPSSTPSGSASRPSAGPCPDRGIPPRPTGGPGWCWPPTPAAPGPPDRWRPAAAVGTAPTPAAAVSLSGAAWLSAAAVRPRLAGGHAETRRALPRPAQGPLLGTCRAVPGDQEARQEAPQEATHDGEGCLTGPAHPPHPPTSVDGQPGMPEGVKSQA